VHLRTLTANQEESENCRNPIISLKFMVPQRGLLGFASPLRGRRRKAAGDQIGWCQFVEPACCPSGVRIVGAEPTGRDEGFSGLHRTGAAKRIRTPDPRITKGI